MDEPAFVPKPGQVDYTRIRYAPVINCVVRYGGRILIVERSPGMRLYPGHWNGISGFLDDNRDVEDHARKELDEELGIGGEAIVTMRRGAIFAVEAPEIGKTWIVHPVLIDVGADQITLDWEAAHYKWVSPEEVLRYKLVPGFDRVVATFFPVE
ncbi:MAG: NUDIX domain-containing protein [bacterium]|nr:NUDIX domain-containing protein [bacterium]MDZ4296692.1 NUDIX domain-containing protein [Patescibacteria group bacterium]